ncbi:MAG TPA: MMPL family transporter, partial [Mycobacteriales bacterium]|nr:MMPL family transporter [Mycobacteriales bacterium]
PMSLPRPGPLGRLAAVAVRRRRLVVAGWLLAVVALLGLANQLSGEFEADYTAQGSDSAAAAALLTERFPAQGGVAVDVVVRADAGVEAARADVERLVAELGDRPGVLSTTTPWEPGGSVSADGRTGLGSVRLDAAVAEQVEVEEARALLEIAADAERPGLQVALGGQVPAIAEQGEIGSEGIGLLAAAVVLLLTFGTVVAAGLPIAVAVLGLVASTALIGLLTAVLGVPEWATSLAAMMGIGVGIDYVLLLVTRYREQLARGLAPADAVVRTMDTAGRAVLVAGGTVVISLLGLAAMGLSYMTGAAVATMIAVTVVVLAALTLLPALLGMLGTRVDRWRLLRTRPARAGRPGGWERWALAVQRRPVVALLAGAAVLAVLAAPLTGLRFGFPDSGNDPAGTSAREAYDLTVDAFGAGAPGPLLVVTPDGSASLAAVARAAESLPGVAQVGEPVVAPDGTTALLTVVPTTSPQDPATEQLVAALRDAGGDAVHVGGWTAMALDQTDDVAGRLPLLVAGVVGLSFLLLLAVFRSPAVAVKAAVLNLVSIAAAYGVVALVLEGGWAGQLLGIDTPTPLPAFVPVLMFAVLFGLSMDYEVFLLSGVREAWSRTRDSRGAAVAGLAGTGRVITAAAAIMVVVFGAFVPSDQVFLKVIGVGLATAILVDATVVRMLLVPAVMQLLGDRAWALPRWLDRLLPHVHVEGPAEPVAPTEPASGSPVREPALQPA